MQEIKLVSMEIRNFKKIRDSGKLTFESNNIEIRGWNESGKSTIADAFFWCLFGKNSLDAKVFSIKPLDSENNEIHYLETSVEVVLSVDGTLKSFKRVMNEIWRAIRGSDEKSYGGNETVGFVDGVPKKITDFQKEINNVIDEELFKLLTSTTYFNSLHWTKQREIIFKLVSGVKDIDIIRTNAELLPLEKEIATKSVEDLKAQLAIEMKIYDKQIKVLPAEIKTLSEITYDLPDDFNPERNQVQIDLKSKKRDELLMKSSAQTQNAKVDEIEKTIYSIKSANRKLEAEKEVAKDEAERSKNIAVGGVKTKIDAHIKNLKSKSDEITALNDRIAKGELALETKKGEREDLIAEFKEIKARVFSPESDTCPTCGSKWPMGKMEEFEKHFNLDKASALEKNRDKGLALKSEIEKFTTAIDDFKDKIKYLEMEKEGITAEIEILENEVKEMESQEIVVIGVAKIDEQLEINQNRIKLLESQLELATTQVADDDVNHNQDELDKLKGEIELLNKYKVNYQNEKVRVESIILKEQEMKSAQVDYEKANKVMTLIGKFVEYKGKYLSSTINKPFKLVKFKLSKLNELAGTIEDTFIATVNGVPFSDVNDGTRIQAGLDIIGGLQNIYQVKMPIFIDRAEVVTHWKIDLDCQQIKLYADINYPEVTFINGEAAI